MKQGTFSSLATSVPLVALLAWGCSDPESAKRSFLERGSAYMAEGRVREAITQYRNAIEQDPRFGEARLKLAEAYLKDDQLPRALTEAVRAADCCRTIETHRCKRLPCCSPRGSSRMPKTG